MPGWNVSVSFKKRFKASFLWNMKGAYSAVVVQWGCLQWGKTTKQNLPWNLLVPWQTKPAGLELVHVLKMCSSLAIVENRWMSGNFTEHHLKTNLFVLWVLGGVPCAIVFTFFHHSMWNPVGLSLLYFSWIKTQVCCLSVLSASGIYYRGMGAQAWIIRISGRLVEGQDS